MSYSYHTLLVNFYSSSNEDESETYEDAREVLNSPRKSEEKSSPHRSSQSSHSSPIKDLGKSDCVTSSKGI